MFDINWIRQHAEDVKAGLRARGWDGLHVEDTVARLFVLDDDRRAVIAKTQKFQEERNRLSKEVGQAMARKEPALAEALKVEVNGLKAAMEGAETEQKDAVRALEAALADLPNLPLADVPIGPDESGNVEVRRFGQAPAFTFKAKEHFEVGESLGLMDFDAAARLSGARFVVNKGPLARLERALGQFMLDLHTGEHGYTEVNPPLLLRDAAFFGTNQLPKFENDQFWAVSGELLAGQDTIAVADLRQARFGLLPTAEVPLTNLVREQIVEERDLPMRFTALTPCFRAEAGAAGRDTRGMIRQHQFTKVELVAITTPEQALDEHERLTQSAEEVLKRLGLHYRVMALCTGDMGFGAQKTYDIEVWLPGVDDGQGRFREISSCSVCGEFQARRMNARFRPAGAKSPRFVATLNGSGIAVGRALVAVLENYQNEDGSVTVPDVLLPYMGGVTRIERP